MPGNQFHTHAILYVPKGNINIIGALLPDHVRRCDIYSYKDVHEPDVYKGARVDDSVGYSWVPEGMLHHAITDKIVDKKDVFVRCVEVAVGIAREEDLMLAKRRSGEGDSLWETHKHYWNGHFISDMALCYPLWVKDKDHPYEIEENWKALDMGALANSLCMSLNGNPRERSYDKEVRRVRKGLDESRNNGFFSGAHMENMMTEHSDIFRRVLGHERVGLGSDSAWDDFFEKTSREIASRYWDFVNSEYAWDPFL